MSYVGVGMPPGLGVQESRYEVPYKDEQTGKEGVAVATTGPDCGDPYALQVMLYWLGFYQGDINGKVDDETRAATLAYALSKGISYNPTQPAQGQLCQALMDDHAAYWEQPPKPATEEVCAAGQWGAPPFCFGEPTHEPPPTAGTCPAGSFGLPPNCVSVPGTTPTAPPAGAAQCPSGQVGIPPNCYGLPGLPGGAPPGPPQPPAPPKPQPGHPPPVQPPGPVLPPAEKPEGWFSQRSVLEKALVIGGGALLTAVLFGLVIRRQRPKKRAKPNRYRKNRARPAAARARARKKAKRKRRRPRVAKGKVIMVGKGKKKRPFGRTAPLKKYRKKGWVRRSQYAWPDGYMYPVGDAKHCRNAASRFAQNKSAYPMSVRRTIAKNINKCKKKFGVGGEVVKP